MEKTAAVVGVIACALLQSVLVTCDECPGFPAEFSNPVLQCAPRDTCNRTFHETNNVLNLMHSNCHCDDECLMFGDCCRDKLAELTSGSTYPLRTLEDGSHQCRWLPHVYSTGLRITSVIKCPSTWENRHEKELCDNADEHASVNHLAKWPVSDSAGIVYKNVYCALCHGRLDYQFWHGNMTCEVPMNATSRQYARYLQNGTCVLQAYMPPTEVWLKETARLCKRIVKTCRQTWSDGCVRDLCEGPASVVSYVYNTKKRKGYKNKYCAHCNGVTPRHLSCEDLYLFRPIKTDPPKPTFYPLNILFDVQSGTPSATYRVGTKAGDLYNETVVEYAGCNEGQVYDPFASTCRVVRCPEGSVNVNGSCVTRTTNGSQSTNDCAWVPLNQSEYLLFENGDLYLNTSDNTVGPEFYGWSPNGDLLLCTNYSQYYNRSRIYEAPQPILKFSNAQTIVSVTGQTLSIIALILHLVVYSLFPQLQNLAGKNLMSLATSLLLAQLFFLFGVGRSENYSACAAVAVVIHYTFLASFIWMAVMAFDIWQTFSKSVALASSDSHWKRFGVYSAVAWLTPLFVIGMALCTNFLGPEGSPARPEYGEGVCWIANRSALFLYFALPVALVLIINSSFFIATTISICKVQENTKAVTKKSSDKNRLVLYVKLCAIMGLTWIFAFIAAAADSEVCWYIFLIFNSLQGVFIFCAFALTQKVLALLRERFSGGGHHRRSGASKATNSRTYSTVTSNRKQSETQETVLRARTESK